jgi:valyl-tRNA synthetase
MQPNENIPAKLLKPYDPVETEGRIYKLWEESGFFNPDICVEKGVTKADAKPYTIMMPPPNVTGVLHMGHAMMLTLEDILIRYHRMKGDRTLWLPGTDHAAIATQSKVEKEISKKEGKSRHDLGREEMLKRIGKFAQESHDTIASQIRVMGSSCDWSREAFTLDAKRNFAVRTAFKKMYDDGIIYRGFRIINWDPKGQTTISDDEIVYEERKAILYTFKYSKDFPIAISTTRTPS